MVNKHMIELVRPPILGVMGPPSKWPKCMAYNIGLIRSLLTTTIPRDDFFSSEGTRELDQSQHPSEGHVFDEVYFIFYHMEL